MVVSKYTGDDEWRYEDNAHTKFTYSEVRGMAERTITTAKLQKPVHQITNRTSTVTFFSTSGDLGRYFRCD